jgi:hypothetical protein
MTTLLLIGYVLSVPVGFLVGFKFLWNDWMDTASSPPDTEVFVMSAVMGVLFGFIGPIICVVVLIRTTINVLAKKDRLIKLGHKIAGTK